MLKTHPPKSEQALLESCKEIEGLTYAQLALKLGVAIPQSSDKRKGWLGQAIELALGANAQNHALPDFIDLGIELKTLPLSLSGSPVESTFVTSISLLTIHKETWETSQCYSKLRRILWVPVEGERDIPYEHRRIGRGFLWSPNANQLGILSSDWSYFAMQISTGYLDQMDARVGEYLQIRPKAAHGKSLCFAYDVEGNKVKTLPRGFYLRSSFTKSLL